MCVYANSIIVNNNMQVYAGYSKLIMPHDPLIN